MNKRILSILFVILLIIPAIAAAVITTWDASAGTDFSTSTGVEVSLLGDEEIQSGDIFTSRSVKLQNVTFHGDNATIAMYPGQWNSNGWTNVTAMSVTSGNVTIDPDDKNEFSFNGSVTTVNFTNVIPSDGIDVDFYYSATGGSAGIIVPNLTAGEQWGMISVVTGEGLDIAIANATGYGHYDNVPFAANQAIAMEPLGILYIREETPAPHNIINSTTVYVKFWPEGGSAAVGPNRFTIVEKTTTTGMVDLTGLPILGTFEVIAVADGYHNRTAIIRNLGIQNTMFLLNKSVPDVNVHFQIDDLSGSYQPDDGVSMYIKRAINVSSYDPTNATGWAWMTVAGMNLGNAQTFNSTLNTNERYDIVIENDNGDVRSMGGYIPTWDNPTTAANPQVLKVTNADVVMKTDLGYSYNVTFNDTNPADPKIHLIYSDPQQFTTNLTWYITPWNNVTVIAGPYGPFCNPVRCGELTAVQGLATLDPFYLNNTLQVHVDFWKLAPSPGLVNGTTTTVYEGYKKMYFQATINKEGIFSAILPVAPYWLHLISIGLIILVGAGVGATLNKGIGGMAIALLAIGLNAMGFMPPEVNDSMYVVALLLSVVYWYATEKR